jgi:hypothetical protein
MSQWQSEEQTRKRKSEVLILKKWVMCRHLVFAEKHRKVTGYRDHMQATWTKQPERRASGGDGRTSRRRDALVKQFCTLEALTSVRRANRVASIVMRQGNHW